MALALALIAVLDSPLPLYLSGIIGAALMGIPVVISMYGPNSFFLGVLDDVGVILFLELLVRHAPPLPPCTFVRFVLRCC